MKTWVYKRSSIIIGVPTIVNILVLIMFFHIRNQVEVNSSTITQIYKYGILFAIPSKIIFILLLCISITNVLLVLYFPLNNRFKQILSIILTGNTFLIFMHMISYLYYNSPMFPYSFRYYGYAEYILRNSKVNASIIWYHNWPGFPIEISIFELITETNPIILLGIFPYLTVGMSAMYVYMLSRGVINDKNSVVLAPLLFILLNWSQQTYFTAQNYSYLLYLNGLYISLLMLRKQYRKIKLIVILLVIMLSLTISHILMSIFTTLLIFTLTLAINSPLKKDNLIHIKKYTALIWIFILIIVMWNSLWASSWTIPRITHILISLSRLSSIDYAKAMMEGTKYHELYTKIKLVSTLTIILISLSLQILKTYKVKTFTSSIRLFSATLIASGVVIALGTHGGESIIRGYLYFLPALTISMAEIMSCVLPQRQHQIHTRNIVTVGLFIFMILLTPLSFYNIWGNYAIEYVSYQEITGVGYAYMHIPPQSYINVPSSSIFEWKYREYFKLIQVESQVGEYLVETPLTVRFTKYLKNQINTHSTIRILQLNSIYINKGAEEFRIFLIQNL